MARKRRDEPATSDWHWSAPGTTEAPPRLVSVVLDEGSMWLCEVDDGLVILDPVAVDRELMVARMQRALAAGTIPSQRLLFPVRLSCEEGAGDAAELHTAALARLGFDLRRAGPQVLTLCAVAEPIAGGAMDPVSEVLVELLLSELDEARWVEQLCAAAAQMKGRSDVQVDAVLADWLALDSPAKDRSIVERLDYAHLRTQLTGGRNG